MASRGNPAPSDGLEDSLGSRCHCHRPCTSSGLGHSDFIEARWIFLGSAPCTSNPKGLLGRGVASNKLQNI